MLLKDDGQAFVANATVIEIDDDSYSVKKGEDPLCLFNQNVIFDDKIIVFSNYVFSHLIAIGDYDPNNYTGHVPADGLSPPVDIVFTEDEINEILSTNIGSELLGKINNLFGYFNTLWKELQNVDKSVIDIVLPNDYINSFYTVYGYYLCMKDKITMYDYDLELFFVELPNAQLELQFPENVSFPKKGNIVDDEAHRFIAKVIIYMEDTISRLGIEHKKYHKFNYDISCTITGKVEKIC